MNAHIMICKFSAVKCEWCPKMLLKDCLEKHYEEYHTLEECPKCYEYYEAFELFGHQIICKGIWYKLFMIMFSVKFKIDINIWTSMKKSKLITSQKLKK